MTTLNDVKVGDTVFLDWYDTLSYVEVVRITNTQIIIRAKNGNEYRFRKKNGDIAQAGYNNKWHGNPRISVKTVGTDNRFAAQQKEQKRRAMIRQICDIAFDKLSTEQLGRILGIINEVTE